MDTFLQRQCNPALAHRNTIATGMLRDTIISCAACLAFVKEGESLSFQLIYLDMPESYSLRDCQSHSCNLGWAY